MFLDIVLLIILVFAIIKGYQRGLIVGVFSFIAIIIGLAAALKLSALAAGYIGNSVNLPGAWLPVISFAVVFIIVVLLVRLGANMIQRTVEFSMLGWVNRLGGIIFYLAIFVVVYSIVLFYADQVHLINDDAKQKSVSYTYVQPWGPGIINSMGSVVPFFKGMFSELQNFFDGVAQKIPEATTGK
jgi:membrane protein required for colicin V production